MDNIKLTPSELSVVPSEELAKGVQQDLAIASSGSEVQIAIKDLYDRQTRREQGRKCRHG